MMCNPKHVVYAFQSTAIALAVAFAKLLVHSFYVLSSLTHVVLALRYYLYFFTFTLHLDAQEWDRGCHERYGRIYQPNGLAWCAKYKSSSEWLQVDLGVAAKVRTHMLEHRQHRSNLKLNTLSQNISTQHTFNHACVQLMTVPFLRHVVY